MQGFAAQGGRMRSLLVHVTGDRIGDALIKLPVLRGLRAAAPEYRIVWVCGRRESVFKGSLQCLVDGVLDEVRERAGIGAGLRELIRPPFAGEYFDVVVATEQGIGTTLLLRRIAHGVFVSPAAGYLLSERRPSAPPPKALAARLRQLFELALERPIEPDPRIPLPEAYLAAARELLPGGAQYIGFAPGAGGTRKRWPLTAYLELARAQAARGRVPVFFLGPQESGWRGAIERAVPGARFPEEDYAGPLARGPILVMALGTRVALTVANDAGPGHMLAATGKPVITLFGHTDPDKFAPAGANRHVIAAAQFGSRRVADIPLRAVAARVEDILGLAPRAGAA
jgi:ADP-heptose:LPS heptosyltransferase